MKWAYPEYIDLCLPRLRPEGGAQNHFQSSIKPNPLRDGDGKPRVSVDLSDCSFSVFPALPEIAIFKDSRAAESDIVKVTEGDACCF